MTEVQTPQYPLKWDQIGEKLYELGTSHGVLYRLDTKGEPEGGVAWNGLVAVKQAPDGAEAKPIYANDHKYIEMTSAENFKGTIEAFTYPEEFKACDGSKEIIPGVYAGQQRRIPFHLAYSTKIGNDTEGETFAEKIHLIYSAKVAPSARDYTTINEDPEAITFSWEFTTTPMEVAQELVDRGFKNTAYIEIDGSLLKPAQMKAIKDILYGTADVPARMPKINELADILATTDEGAEG